MIDDRDPVDEPVASPRVQVVSSGALSWLDDHAVVHA
jgi:hypothetical protein